MRAIDPKTFLPFNIAERRTREDKAKLLWVVSSKIVISSRVSFNVRVKQCFARLRA